MGRVLKEWILVSIICVLAFGLHLFLSIQSAGIDLDTYFVLGQADSIKSTGFPVFYDSLNHQGKSFFPPLYFYLVALGGMFVNVVLAAKIVQSGCLALIVPIVYAISRYVTKNKTTSFISAIFAAFTPAMFLTSDRSSPAVLSLVCLFFLSYCILRIEEKGFSFMAVIAAIAALMASAEIFIFIFGMLLYFLILLLEKNKPSVKEVEMTLFIFFLSLWFFILLYKKALFVNGIAVLWHNLPSQLISSYFQEISPLAVFYAAGLIPLVLGTYAIYHVSFESKNKPVLLYVGFAIASFIVLWARIMTIETAMFFFSINMIILSSYTLKVAHGAVSKMKVEKALPYAAIFLVVIFLLSSIYPVLAFRTPNPEREKDIAALTWLSQNSNASSRVLSHVDEGFMVSYYSKRPAVADSNFLMVKDSDKLYADIMSMYSLRLSSEAVRLLDKYDVNYIFLSEGFQQKTGTRALFYEDSECIEKIYDDVSVIYEFKNCRLEE